MAQPAARLGDMHVCPLQTPAVVPIPHVGGPIVSPGCPQVLIAGMPAACVGDMCVCTGPPDAIAMGSYTVLIGGKPAARQGDLTVHGGSIVVGCPTVLIGDSGGGSGSPQAFTMSAAKAAAAPFTQMNCAVAGAAASAMPAQSDPPPAAPNAATWIEIVLKDRGGTPIPHERYLVTVPGRSKPIEGFLDANGTARVEGLNPGECKVSFPNLPDQVWGPTS